MADEESPEAILNATTHPDVRTIFVELLDEVKKMNENFTNTSYVDEKDEAANDIVYLVRIFKKSLTKVVENRKVRPSLCSAKRAMI